MIFILHGALALNLFNCGFVETEYTAPNRKKEKNSTNLKKATQQEYTRCHFKRQDV